MNYSVSEQSSSCFGGFRCPTLDQSNGIQIRRTDVSPEDYEALLNEGMKHLTFDEIQHEQEVLHGVAGEKNLPENTINELLTSLQEHLDQIKTGTAYEMAEHRDRAYPFNPELQTAFLRANRYDPKEAASKIVRFFKYKHELFGDECLARDITTKDLDKDDLRCLLRGNFQYSPIRDRSGRKVFLEFPGVRSRTPLRTELRARFYMWANSVEALVDASEGLVTVSYHVGQFHDHLKGAGYVDAYDLFSAIPVDVAGHHLCTENRWEMMLLNTLCTMMPYRLRVKTKIHYGSHTECQYLLSSYGISRDALPLTGPNSDMNLSHHQAWYQQMIFQEQQQSLVPLASSEKSCPAVQNGPTENDVLCLGRVVKSVGNNRLQSSARQHFNAYENGSPSTRLEIVNQIIDEIHSHGGRFLKPDDASIKHSISNVAEAATVWKELSPDEQCVKVAQLFRNLRRRRSRLSPSTAHNSTFSSGSSSVAPTASPTVVYNTRPEDVLLGYRMTNNPGNKRLRELVLGATDDYEQAGRGKKKEIVLRVIATIHHSGGRFLASREDMRWEVVSEQFARDRISKQFRNLRRHRGEK